MTAPDTLPVIDVAPLVRAELAARGGASSLAANARGEEASLAAAGHERLPSPAPGHDAVLAAARAIGDACRRHGFFYVRNHGVPEALQQQLDGASRAFFALDDATKSRIAMERGGRAWRGHFPVGGELTSGKPDRKEGLYFGTELSPDDRRVKAGLPLHGANLFPAAVPQLRDAVLAYLDALTLVGHALTRGIALSLGLDGGYFTSRYTAEPLVLFRIFRYPAEPGVAQLTDAWGVGEHTDYGLLTILRQDDVPGLEVRSPEGWIDAPPLPGTFVCNIGDMLDRMTRGFYRSTAHRVRPPARDRLSFPFFFDPSWDARIEPLDLSNAHGHDAQGAGERWDGADLQAFGGTYGEYLTAKVSRVFPALAERT